MKKIIISISSFFMSLVLIGTTLTTYANTNINDEENVKTYKYTQEEIDRSEKEQIDKYLESIKSTSSKSDIMPKNPEYDYEYISRPSGSPVTAVGKDIGWAGGQLSGGYVFQNGKGTFNWSDGGYDTSISLGVGGQIFSISVSAGKKVSGIGELGIEVQQGRYAKLWIRKDIKSQKHIVYRRNIYTGDETVYSQHYTHTPVAAHLVVKYL